MEIEKIVGSVETNGGKLICTLEEYKNMHIEMLKQSSGLEIYFWENQLVKKLGYPKDRDGFTFVPPWESEDYICYYDISISDVKQTEKGNIYIIMFDLFIEEWSNNNYCQNPPIEKGCIKKLEKHSRIR